MTCNLLRKLRGLLECDCRPEPEAQPRPICTVVNRDHHSDGWSTTIARLFRPEDVPRCKLCPSCSASEHGLCQITFYRFVPDEEARLVRFERAETV